MAVCLPSRRWLSARLRAGEVIVAPVLLPAEVGGAVARQTNQLKLGQRAIDRWLSFHNLRLISLDHVAGIRAARLAADQRLGGADALYVATATLLSIPLVSWDQQQLDRAKGLVEARAPE